MNSDNSSPTPQITNIRFESPDNIFDWSKISLIGTGGIGCVYKARCKTDVSEWETNGSCLKADEMYAVKVINKSLLSDNEILRFVIHEIEILRLLSSPYCVKLYDAFQSNREVFLVLELVEGGELFDVLKERGQFSEQEAVQITKHLLDALVYIHEAKVVHRDLKPENILINRKSLSIKLVDFGMAKFIGKLEESPYPLTPNNVAPPCLTPGSLSPGVSPCTPSGLLSVTPRGSHSYLAPETVARMLKHGVKPRVTTRTDIQKLDMFALGVIVYVMLGGAFPFTSKSKTGLAAQIEAGVNFPDSRFGGVSEHAKSFCRWLLDPDRRKRPLAVECFNHEWLRTPVSSTPISNGVMIDPVDSAVFDQMREMENEYDDESQSLPETNFTSHYPIGPPAPILSNIKLELPKNRRFVQK